MQLPWYEEVLLRKDQEANVVLSSLSETLSIQTHDLDTAQQAQQNVGVRMSRYLLGGEIDQSRIRNRTDISLQFGIGNVCPFFNEVQRQIPLSN